MEWMNVASKPSVMSVSICFALLLSVTLASASEADENSGGSGRPSWNLEGNAEDRSSWNEDSLWVKFGSNLTLSCLVDTLDLQYEVFRISLIQGDVLFALVENGLVHAPFSNIPRYRAWMDDESGNGGARMTILVEDVQPEDGGTYICSKYLEGDNSAVLNVTVVSPVEELYITSMDPDGEEMQMEAESEVFLQEHDFYGVGCVATVDGSQTMPQVRVEIDGKDETESFQVFHQVDASILPSGLTLWKSHLRLALVSATPNPDYNEKLMRCIASQTGFPDVEASTRLLVQFAPLIRCVPERLVARQGTSTTLDCNIRANPGSRITWSSARGDLSNYPNVFFDETVISSDETRLTLSIRNIRPINFQRYTLTAANIVSSSQSTFELVEDETVVMERRPEVESFPSDDESIVPEMVEDVFPDGNNDFTEMDMDWFVRRKNGLTIEPSGISSPEDRSTIQTSSSSVEGDLTTVASVVSISSNAGSTLAVVGSTLQDIGVIYPETTSRGVKSTPQDLESTLSFAESTSPYDKSTIQDARIAALPNVKSPSPDIKRTLPKAKASFLDIKNTSTIEFSGVSLPDPTSTALPSARIPSPSGGKSHSSPGRVRSTHHKGTSIPPKAARDALPVAATAAVPTKPSKPTRVVVASSDELEQQQSPAASGEVQYSHSRSASSASSSSKKDSGKSGKSSKSASSADVVIVAQYFLVMLLLIIQWA